MPDRGPVTVSPASTTVSRISAPAATVPPGSSTERSIRLPGRTAQPGNSTESRTRAPAGTGPPLSTRPGPSRTDRAPGSVCGMPVQPAARTGLAGLPSRLDQVQVAEQVPLDGADVRPVAGYR